MVTNSSNGTSFPILIAHILPFIDRLHSYFGGCLIFEIFVYKEKKKKEGSCPFF